MPSLDNTKYIQMCQEFLAQQRPGYPVMVGDDVVGYLNVPRVYGDTSFLRVVTGLNMDFHKVSGSARAHEDLLDPIKYEDFPMAQREIKIRINMTRDEQVIRKLEELVRGSGCSSYAEITFYYSAEFHETTARLLWNVIRTDVDTVEEIFDMSNFEPVDQRGN